MPRRRTPDPLAEAIGSRIRALRQERGLTAERLAYESDLGSKGYLSDIEHGLALPSVHKLAIIAEHLGCALLDLVTFPDGSDREALVDVTRHLGPGPLRKLLRQAKPARPKPAPGAPRTGRQSLPAPR